MIVTHDDLMFFICCGFSFCITIFAFIVFDDDKFEVALVFYGIAFVLLMASFYFIRDLLFVF